jgi:tetratricopeptide (TPR) repeat protein
LELIESDRDSQDLEVGLRSVDELKCLYRSLNDASRSTALDLVECGEAFRSFGLLDDALECFGKGIARDSGCLQAYVRRGELLFELAIRAGSDEEIVRLGWRSINDFRKALVLSLGTTNDVVWRLGIALLLVDDARGAHALAHNVIMKGDAVGVSVRCDFLYLLGLAMVFMGNKRGADEVFEDLVGLEELAGLDCGVESGLFGKLVCCVALSDGAGAEGLLSELQLRHVRLLEAGQCLQRSGCNRFIDVARAFLRFGP